MAATKNLVAYSSSSSLTATLASLSSGSARESVSQVNTSNLYFDYLVALTFTIASGSPSTASPNVNIYANGSVDNTLWPIIQLSSGATKATSGTDNSIGALGTPPNLKLIGSFGLQTTTSGSERTLRTQPFSVAAAFYPSPVPEAFSIIVENSTGVAFSVSSVTTAALLDIVGVYTTSGN